MHARLATLAVAEHGMKWRRRGLGRRGTRGLRDFRGRAGVAPRRNRALHRYTSIPWKLLVWQMRPRARSSRVSDPHRVGPTEGASVLPWDRHGGRCRAGCWQRGPRRFVHGQRGRGEGRSSLPRGCSGGRRRRSWGGGLSRPQRRHPVHTRHPVTTVRPHYGHAGPPLLRAETLAGV